MKKIRYAFLNSFWFLLMLYTTALTNQNSNVLFEDNFQKNPNGAAATAPWVVSKGHWRTVDGVLQQASAEFDCGVLLPYFLDFSFSLEARVRVRDGFPGIGFFFQAADYRQPDFAQMCRFDSPETLLSGYFVQANFEATNTITCARQDFSSWHSLKLLVDLDQENYQLLLDQQVIAAKIPLRYRVGYCGLQASGGVIEFDDVKLTRLPTSQIKTEIYWPGKIGLTKNGEFLIPTGPRGRVQIFDRDGDLVRELGVTPEQQKILLDPVAAVGLNTGATIVADQGNVRLVLFDSQGNWQAATGFKGNGDAQFQALTDLALNEKNEVFALDQPNKRVQVFDGYLNYLGQFGANRLGQPTALTVSHDSVWIFDAKTAQVELFRWQGRTTQWLKSIKIEPGECRSLSVIGPGLYLTLGNRVVSYALNGEKQATFLGESLEAFYPWGILRLSERQLAIADFMSSRLIYTNEALLDPTPQVQFPNRKTAIIQWQTDTPLTGELTVKQGDQIWLQKRDPAPVTQHHFTVNGLKPSTVFTYQISPALQSFPAGAVASKNFSFITPAAAGKKHFRELKMATIIFANVLDSARQKPGWPGLPPLPESEIARLKQEIADGIRFYWVNSRLNFWIDMDYYVITDLHYRHQIFGPESWYPPLAEKIYAILTQAGKKEGDYRGLNYIACMRDFNPQTGEYELVGRGGGFTAGIESNGKAGISWWEVTAANHNAGNNWLFVHEFHHQLDALFLASGYPEYWFNHFAPHIGTAADFGEHFDGNAWILRAWPEPKWYGLSYGTLAFTTDRDDDGVPDDDPRLPLDEKRLGSNPQKIDTDGDGLTDLQELAAANWVTAGWGEDYRPPQHFPNLNTVDTDRDGLTDKADPYPLYPEKPEIHADAPTLDGVLQAQEWSPFATLHTPKLQAEVFANWDSLYLYFAFRLNQPVPIKLMLDADADGWFSSQDNYLLKLIPQSDGRASVKVDFFNAGVPNQWPFMDRELAAKVNAEVVAQTSVDRYVLEFRVPRDPALGLDLKSGEEIGLLLGFLMSVDEHGHQRYLTLWEPHRFFDVRLLP
ncbi:hypothetical protein L0128_16120 [candidate division KSB1 bacterium]|nr:hypothetical protein [candidate division KSB1 bacterium]